MKTHLRHRNLRRKRAWRRCDQTTCYCLTALEAEIGASTMSHGIAHGA